MVAQKLKLLTIITLPMLAVQEVRATKPQETESNSSSTQNQNLLSEKCPSEIPGREGYPVYTNLKYSQNFFAVRTQEGELRLRESPGGRIIGAIPSGWQVYVAKYDSSRRWAYIRSSKGFYGFASAPNFNSDGWVSIDFLVPLGEYCAKPNELALLPADLPIALSEETLPDTLWHTLEVELLDKLNRS
ncbi:MAG: hypothetical protein MUD14_23475 [Hydrococcus sp. Prado102]|jgi:hypothetical protein|nr:hypothetical protein [Hydrococcus sp. Prado102]